MSVVGNAAAMTYYLKPIEARDPAEESRVSAMIAFLNERSYVCICQLIVLFHVGKLKVLEVLGRLVDEGKFTKKDWPSGLIAGELIYRSTRETQNEDQLVEIANKIQFAVDVLAETFPGYKRAVSLDEQGAVGRQVKRTLGAAVTVLAELELVPKYWGNMRHNQTSIVLSLQELLGDGRAVKEFLRVVQDFPQGINGALRGIERNVDALDTSLKEALETLRNGNDEVEAILARC